MHGKDIQKNFLSKTSISVFYTIPGRNIMQGTAGTLQMVSLAKTMTGAEWNGEKKSVCVLLPPTYSCTVVLHKATVQLEWTWGAKQTLYVYVCMCVWVSCKILLSKKRKQNFGHKCPEWSECPLPIVVNNNK